MPKDDLTVSPFHIEKYLKGMDFPAELDDLIEHARENDAPDEIIEMLEEMPDREYGSAADVARGFGEAYNEDEEE